MAEINSLWIKFVMAAFMGIVETGEDVEKLLYQIDYPKANV